VDQLITAANGGNLSNRIELASKIGFFKNISEGLNNLFDSTKVFVGDIGNMSEAMSQGNLTQEITRDYRGEFNRIKNNANISVNKLVDDLSRRTESQASSLEETAVSMEEITATIKQTTQNSNQSTTMAADAKNKAELGDGVLQNAVTAMAETLQSSNKINDIISVIDEIAFHSVLPQQPKRSKI
jgi:methyl-accepting chemotaxis protein